TIVRAPAAEAALAGARAPPQACRAAGPAARAPAPPLDARAAPAGQRPRAALTERRRARQRGLPRRDARGGRREDRGGSDRAGTGRVGAGPGVPLGPRSGDLRMAEVLELTVDGVPLTATGDPGRTLLRVLRDDLGRTGTKEGCDDSECGACMVLVDGRPVNSCSYLALQAAGRHVTTVEGLAGPGDELHPLQQAFL